MRKTEEILNDILRNRGITDPDDISEFLSERPRKTYDPFLLHNMEAGVDLLLNEINNGTKICIYGDYDADGVTSVCILSNALRMLTDNFTYYIPSRFDEGYGLNKEAVKKIRVSGAGMIITVDCGSVSYEEVEYAKELGMKVIVTDHHSIDDRKNAAIRSESLPGAELHSRWYRQYSSVQVCRKVSLQRCLTWQQSEL